MPKNLTDGDYTLSEGAGWFTVKGFAVRIQSTDEGVVVDVYKDGAEMEEVITSTYAFDNELLDDEEEDDAQ
jgi:hypothetical protein